MAYPPKIPPLARAMNSSTPSGDTQPPLIDSILLHGKLAFDPELSAETRAINAPRFAELLNSTGTLALLPALNLLVQPGRVQPWLRIPVISSLARIPLRPRGVQDAIEFVVSVHSSRSAPNEASDSGKGPSISHEALNASSKLLSSPPAGMSPNEWFSGIAPQLLSLLSGHGEPEIDRAAAYIIGFGILGRKQYGAPGTPGWEAFAVPILGCVDPAIVSSRSSSQTFNSGEEAVTQIGTTKVLVSPQDLANSLKQLSVLLTSHPHPSLAKRLLRPILLSLWSLAREKAEGRSLMDELYRKPANLLLKTFLRLSSADSQTNKSGSSSVLTPLTTIVQYLMFRGRSESGSQSWEYEKTVDGLIQVVQPMGDGNRPNEAAFLDIDSVVGSFVVLIDSIPDLDADLSTLFMNLCTKWLAAENKQPEETVLTRVRLKHSGEDFQQRIIEASILQKLMTSRPEKLVNDSLQVLTLVKDVLYRFVEAGSDKMPEEDIVVIGLSLLSVVLTSPRFRAAPDNEALLESIRKHLESISKQSDLEVSSTSQNLLLLLSFRSVVEDSEQTQPATITDQQVEDRKTYHLAMSYLTTTDSPPPVRAQGLSLLSNLIESSSSTLDIPTLLILLSNLLQDSDSYIYLRVIQMYTLLSRRHPKTTINDLIEHYIDATESLSLDQRLRTGEALLQAINSNTTSLTGALAQSLSSALLYLSSRRGHRPKTQQQQRNRAKLQQAKTKEAEAAWGGAVPHLNDDDSEVHPESDVLVQIVSGWESSRGAEDVRIRASALSNLGSAIEANVAGIGPRTVSAAMDLSIHILTLEWEFEKAILRRSAVLLVLSFVTALDVARESGVKLGFGLTGQSLDDVRRVLEYVSTTDNDELVRRHAVDVVEGLKGWEFHALIPASAREGETSEMGELAGLAIHPRVDAQREGRDRPRIEEIE